MYGGATISGVSIEHSKKHPPPGLTYRPGLDGYDRGSFMAETLLWCHAVRICQKYVFWNLLEIRPPVHQADVLPKTLCCKIHPKQVPGKLLTPGCCWTPRALGARHWRGFPLLQEFGDAKAVFTTGALCWGCRQSKSLAGEYTRTRTQDLFLLQCLSIDLCWFPAYHCASWTGKVSEGSRSAATEQQTMDLVKRK